MTFPSRIQIDRFRASGYTLTSVAEGLSIPWSSVRTAEVTKLRGKLRWGISLILSVENL